MRHPPTHRYTCTDTDTNTQTYIPHIFGHDITIIHLCLISIPQATGWSIYIYCMQLYFSLRQQKLSCSRERLHFIRKGLTNGYCEISRIATNIETVFPFKPFSLEVLQTWIFTKLIQNLGKQTKENMKKVRHVRGENIKKENAPFKTYANKWQKNINTWHG